MSDSRTTVFLCCIEDIAEDSAIRLNAAGEDLILVRWQGQFYAYRNDCPHMNMPLTNYSSAALSKDHTRLLCRQHAAQFDIESGLCVEGSCVGMNLHSLAIKVLDGEVFLLN